MALLEIKGLSKSFGGLAVLSDIDLHVAEKEIVGLIGPNGSGKSTLFNTIMGSLKPDGGSVLFRGREIAGLNPHQVCKQGIGRTFQLTRPFNRMTCLENVMVGRSFGSGPVCSLKETRSEAREILSSVGLLEKRNTVASGLNLIERKRLELAKALATRPYLLLLDEIMAGLNPMEVDKAVRLVLRINGSGVSVIIVEHVMKVLLGISTRVVVLDAGRKIAEGAPRDVVSNRDVIEAYLGTDIHA
jgi:branched-chain amino acid transport system ATP-binding protein